MRRPCSASPRDAEETLYVSEGGENGISARLLALAHGADDDVPPDRVIVPDGASFVLPQGITASCDRTFRDAFD